MDKIKYFRLFVYCETSRAEMICTPNVRHESNFLEVHFYMSKYSLETKIKADTL
jgi:hypothetical protein